MQTTPVEDAHERGWKRIWNMKGPLRHDMFLWCARHRVLSTMDFLYNRRISSSAQCAVCHGDGKGQVHEIRDCWWARKVWKVFVPTAKWREFSRAYSIRDWIDMNLTKGFGNGFTQIGWRYVFCEAAYGIWYWHNKVKHDTQQRFPPVGTFVRDVVNQVKGVLLANHVPIVLFR